MICCSAHHPQTEPGCISRSEGQLAIPGGAFDRDHDKVDDLETDHMHDWVPEETEGRGVLKVQLTGFFAMSVCAMGGTLMDFWTEQTVNVSRTMRWRQHGLQELRRQAPRRLHGAAEGTAEEAAAAAAAAVAAAAVPA